MSPPLTDLVGYSPLPAASEWVAAMEYPAWGDGGAEEVAVDHFDRLPDSVLLLVFNRIGDVKALGRCCAVSRRFRTLVPLVDDVVVRVDCVISDEDRAGTAASPAADGSDSSHDAADKPRGGGGLFSHLARLVLGGIVRPLQAIGQILAGPSSAGCAGDDSSSSSSSSSFSSSPSAAGCNYKRRHLLPPAAAAAPSSDAEPSDVSHHSPTEVLRNFREIRRLRVELPGGELGVDDGVLLKWKADFGATLNSCVILGASSVLSSSSVAAPPSSLAAESPSDKSAGGGEAGDCFCGDVEGNGGDADNGSLPEAFYTNGSLKLRVVWTISSLIAASARHYLLQPIVAEHGTLDSLDLTDADGQGVLRMDQGQLEELRAKPAVSASGLSQRTLVPALNMRLWYAQQLEVGGGVVLQGATLVAIRPSEPTTAEAADSSSSWWGAGAGDAFKEEEPYGSAVKQLLKRRMYCLEMNSF